MYLLGEFDKPPVGKNFTLRRCRLLDFPFSAVRRTAAPCDEYPLLIMMEYYRRPRGDVKKSSGRPRRGLDDRLPPWREKSLEKRAGIMEMTASPWKDAMRLGVEGGNFLVFGDANNKSAFQFFIKGNCTLHVVLTDRKIPHEFRVRDGAHTWDYWRTGIMEGLKFIGESFRR
jgi:hypothetical protein